MGVSPRPPHRPTQLAQEVDRRHGAVRDSTARNSLQRLDELPTTNMLSRGANANCIAIGRACLHVVA